MSAVAVLLVSPEIGHLTYAQAADWAAQGLYNLIKGQRV